MKEITFLKQNASRWEEYEKKIGTPTDLSPAELTEMFIEITDDLSFAKTHYNNTRTSTYLNGIASRIHQLVYKNKKEKGNRLISFFVAELPLMYRQYHLQLFYSFFVTAAAAFLGVVSQLNDESFARLILGDYYVDSTIERIRHGDPLGIYGEGNQFFMFVQITLNNIRVSFVAFVYGFFTSFGTALFLVYNGIMLGCFFTLFYQYNLLPSAFKVVWIHGTLEISAIIIAGSAGFILGNSFIFPGTHTRMESLMRRGKDGTKIIIGLVPVFICAGFLESFVTRYTHMPLITSLLIIGVSMAFILFYFIAWPIYLTRKKDALRI